VTHHASPDFWARYQALPLATRNNADKAFALLKSNPRHPALHFKKLGRFGQHVRVCITGCLAWRLRMVFYGSGLERMLTTTSWPNRLPDRSLTGRVRNSAPDMLEYVISVATVDARY